MKLLITGGSSVLGKTLISELREIGEYSIRLLEHESSVQQEHCEIYKGDITDVGTLMSACSGIDVVFHLAALSHSHDMKAYVEVNEGGTRNLIAACEENGVERLIYVSSGTASEKGGAYASSKLRGEELVSRSGLKWVIVRPSEIYGPDMREGIGKMIAWVNKYKIIPVVGDGSYCLYPVYLDDVSAAMVHILKNDNLQKEIVDLCGPEQLLFDELIDRLVQFRRVQRKKIYVPLWCVKLGVHILSLFKLDLAFADQIPRLLFNEKKFINKTQAIIPYHPRSLEEGLRSFQSDDL